MYGCSSFIASASTVFSVQSAAFLHAASLAVSSSFIRRNLAISMYQSQNSSHRKSWIFCTAMPSSYRSMFSVTSRATVLTLDKIQRSAG